MSGGREGAEGGLFQKRVTPVGERDGTGKEGGRELG